MNINAIAPHEQHTFSLARFYSGCGIASHLPVLTHEFCPLSKLGAGGAPLYL